MNGSGSSHPPRRLAFLLIGCGALQFAASATRADESEITAVSSQVAEIYARVRLADGSFQPETYTFGEGGHSSGPMRDDSIDKLKFVDVAKVISTPLAKHNYVPQSDGNPEKTKLLITAIP